MLFDADMDEIAGIAELLGGTPVLKKSLETWAEVHDAILAGLPVAARGHFIDYFGDIEEAPDAIDALIGEVTHEGHASVTDRPAVLSVTQGSQLWSLASILFNAAREFGSAYAACLWFVEPAMALDQRKPVDLASTPAGMKALERHLTQMKYCVYI